MEAPARYDRFTIVLHWVTAVLVVLLWAVAQSIDSFPAGFARVTVRSLHMVGGMLLALVLVARIAWRASPMSVYLPPYPADRLGRVARGVQKLLYLLVIATILCGLVNAWVHGSSIFGLVRFASFAPDDRALKDAIQSFHEFLADALLITATMHAAAALLDQYAPRAGLLRRMLPDEQDR